MIRKSILLSALMLSINHATAAIIDLRVSAADRGEYWASADGGEKYTFAAAYLRCSVGEYCTNNVSASAVNEYDVIFRPGASYWSQDGITESSILNVGIKWSLSANGGRSIFMVKNTGISHIVASAGSIRWDGGRDSLGLSYNAGLGYFSATVRLETTAAVSYNGTAQTNAYAVYTNAFADPDFFLEGDSLQYAPLFSIEEQFNLVQTKETGLRPLDLAPNETETLYLEHISVPLPSSLVLFEFALAGLVISRTVSRRLAAL